jgi:rubrerythrin
MTIEEAKAIILKGHCYSAQETVRARKMAAKALDKQIPKKQLVIVNEEEVKFGRVTFGKGTKIFKCSSCEMFISRTDKFCPECGQKIDWR